MSEQPGAEPDAGDDDPCAEPIAQEQAAAEVAADAVEAAQSAESGAAELAMAAEVDAAALRERIAELEDRWRRAAAEVENVRKRAHRDRSRAVMEERSRVAAAWLPVLDNLDRALTHAEADPGSVQAGLRAIRDQAQAVVAGLGFPRRSDEGAQFDPARHEAVDTVVRPQAPAGTVVEVVRAGYGDDGRLLRPAAVVVAAEDE